MPHRIYLVYSPRNAHGCWMEKCAQTQQKPILLLKLAILPGESFHKNLGIASTGTTYDMCEKQG